MLFFNGDLRNAIRPAGAGEKDACARKIRNFKWCVSLSSFSVKRNPLPGKSFAHPRAMVRGYALVA